jgi:hypothetical protein
MVAPNMANKCCKLKVSHWTGLGISFTSKMGLLFNCYSSTIFLLFCVFSHKKTLFVYREYKEGMEMPFKLLLWHFPLCQTHRTAIKGLLFTFQRYLLGQPYRHLLILQLLFHYLKLECFYQHNLPL